MNGYFSEEVNKADVRKDLYKVFDNNHVDTWLASIEVIPKDYVKAFIDYINSLPETNHDKSRNI